MVDENFKSFLVFRMNCRLHITHVILCTVCTYTAHVYSITSSFAIRTDYTTRALKKQRKDIIQFLEVSDSIMVIDNAVCMHYY